MVIIVSTARNVYNGKKYLERKTKQEEIELDYKIATIDDIDTLMEIRLEMLRIVNTFKENQDFSEELVNHSRRYFTEGNQETCLAFDAGVAVGCASISYIEIMPTFSHPTGKRAHLMNVYTKAEYRRQGIAKRMVEMLIDNANRKGVTEISLDAIESGRPLYESLGFRASDECMVMDI